MSISDANPLAYIATARAPLYRSIMRVFMEAKERFKFQLRLHDISEVLQAPDSEEIESALAQLCEWGNLEARSDTTYVTTIEDFLAARKTFQITARGEAAERALEVFENGPNENQNLDGTALTDVLYAVQELKLAFPVGTADAGKVHRNLVLLRARFEGLIATAHTLLAALERGIQSESHDARQLAQYGERFVADFVLTAAGVGEAIQEIETSGFERLLQAVAERCGPSVTQAAPEHIQSIHDQWRLFWLRFCDWFISRPGRLSNAEVLRERIRTALPALLAVITSQNERHIHRIDRSNDFRVLARWFAEAESDADAHRLWRAVFGLCPARHLLINEATLDELEARHVPPNTTWLDAPPLLIPAGVQDYSGSAQAGGLTYIVDRSAEKQKLAAAAHEEAVRILNAQSRFGTGARMRLSELDQLETGELDLLLDLLGEAVSARLLSTEPVEIFSGDGCLKIRLEPAEDGRDASIVTADGVLSGPDHWITIEHVAAEEVLT